ncbi:DUF6944 family repetitive protein [Bacillus sp. KH172YL63]|uniref:DUF6944 family repetitive protein n=1 Tax=Bacillus sp. KH172YL63 TaxID=2709784 RepID=UPI0013E4BE78|nr:hypothetical protein [Bacillus sp. KH172YL63]BCB05556.1 hypothetical protein KH172YL63_36890 [Bacillus sp. KH172YL63]
MSNKQKATFGAWVAAIGTVLAAIGSTPIKRIPEDTLEAFSLIGNEMQGTGNALQADAIDGFSLTKAGNQIQAIGNSTVIAGLLIDFNVIVKQELNIKGNLMQALGGGAALGESFSKEHTTEELFSIYGNLLQIIGNSLQAISGILELNGKDSGKLDVVGSWIQAIGAIISALVQTEASMT